MKRQKLLAAVVLVLLFIFLSYPNSSRADNLIFWEGFNSGIPPTWTVIDGYNDGLTWRAGNAGDYNVDSPFFTNPSAIFDSRQAGAAYNDEQLITPNIDVSRCNGNITLGFANVFTWYVYGMNEIGDVDVSPNGGTSWVNTLRMTNSYGPELRAVDITSIASGKSQVKVKFHYYNARNEFWWIIDAVTLRCYCSTPDSSAPAMTASPVGGTYYTTQSVSLSCNDGGGCGCNKIYYTTNGSTPTTSSAVYSAPINVPQTTTIKFFAVDYAGNVAAVSTEQYTITTPNTPPIANAGPDQTVHVGASVTLDGAQSYDPDGDNPLTYSWTIQSIPAGSMASLDMSSPQRPTFTVDRLGNYIIALVVTDSRGSQSASDTVVISTTNSAPVANAGSGATVHVNTTVSLDGTGSNDPDGDPITFYWSILQSPEGSAAALTNPNAATPSFCPDKTGNYIVQLIVADPWTSSSPATVTISTTNSAPIAAASADPQYVTVRGTTVQLDASQSYDPDGDGIGYTWYLKSKPSGSNAALSSTSSKTPTFIADVFGDYAAELYVWDTWAYSSPVTVTVSFSNLPPVANAGSSQSVSVNQTVTLDGSSSTDPNGDLLTYLWSLSSKPAGCSATIQNSTNKMASLIPDVSGIYGVTLVVNDGFLPSAPSSVTITAVQSSGTAIQKLRDAIVMINSISSNCFKNKNMQNTLTTKINVVISQIEKGEYDEALDKLQHDVYAKLDGCGANCDKNDWVICCTDQLKVQPLILDAIFFLVNW